MKTTVNMRIKQLRSQLKLSQQEFGVLADVSTSLISKIEAGALEPSEDTLIKISDAWNVPIKWLSEGEGELKFDKRVLKQVGHSEGFDPATDTLYKELREQIAFLRNLLTQMAGGKSFPQALNSTGSLEKEFLRALAA